MHPIAHPRMAILLGVMFVAIGLIYYLTSHDIGGSSMLGILGIATSLMAYVLMSGSPRG
jgi:hypothetical protein